MTNEMEKMIELYSQLELSYDLIPWSENEGMQSIIDNVTKTTYIFDKKGNYLGRNTRNGKAILEVERKNEDKAAWAVGLGDALFRTS